MTTLEMLKAKVNEYKILKKRALEVEDYFLAEYYNTLISEITSEMINILSEEGFVFLFFHSLIVLGIMPVASENSF